MYVFEVFIKLCLFSLSSADLISYSHTDLYKTKAFIQSNGDVIWTNPVTWRASCSFDVTWFPVDKQVSI